MRMIKQICSGCFFSAVACAAVVLVSSANAETVARWTFEGTADAAPGPTALPYDSSVLNVTDGHLVLNNQGMTDQSGAALVFPDSPMLTGHADGGTGYSSLVIEADVKLNEEGQQMQIVRKTDGELGYQLFIRPDGRASFYIKTEDGTLAANSKNIVPADGQWHHIEGVWDSSVSVYTAHIAVDGVVICKAPDFKNLYDSKSPLTIGGLYRSENNIGQRFCGEIDNVVISVNRPDLLMVSGRPHPEPGTMTGERLMSQPGFLSMEFVYDDLVTPECHAGTLAQRPDGKMVAAWFGGTREGHHDVGVWQSVFDGSRWECPREVAHGRYLNNAPSATFNPVLFQYPDGGPMLLFYMGGTLDELQGTIKTSADGGRTWSEPQRLVKPICGATKNKPVLLADGTLICPDNSGDRLKFSCTRDFGKTWLEPRLTPPNEIGGIQPTVLIHGGGRLQALARSKTGSIVTSWSSDNGLTWSALEKTCLPNNYSGIDAVTLADGRFLLVYNHTGIPKGKWGGARTPLNVAMSEDGINWSAAVVLEDEPGEYSYPAVVQAADGKVHVLYTWHRLRMKHVVLDPAAVQLRPIVDGQWPQ